MKTNLTNHNPQNLRCSCGNDAHKYNHCREAVCDRCARLESYEFTRQRSVVEVKEDAKPVRSAAHANLTRIEAAWLEFRSGMCLPTCDVLTYAERNGLFDND